MPRARPTLNLQLKPGVTLGRRYRVEAALGRGAEGEVYHVTELATDIPRAVKLTPADRATQKSAARIARKLEHLRDCPIVLQYHHAEQMTLKRQPVNALFSELCPGEPLQVWIDAHRGKKLRPYKALHVFYRLVVGLEQVHDAGEYHSDVHTENIIVQPRGVGFRMKLIDFYDWGKPTRHKQQQDILQAVRVFHDMLGGRDQYAKLPAWAKHLCAGLNNTLILKRFPTMTTLRRTLETFDWD